MTTAALRYLMSIRNRAKRSYAVRYWAWLCADDVVGSPPAQPDDLGDMAAQCVRLRLTEIKSVTLRHFSDTTHIVVIPGGTTMTGAEILALAAATAPEGRKVTPRVVVLACGCLRWYDREQWRPVPKALALRCRDHVDTRHAP